MKQRLLLGLLVLVLGALPVAGQPAVDSPLQKAIAQMRAGDNEAAIGEIEAYALRPEAEPLAKAMLGVLYLEVGRHREALDVLEPLTQMENPDPAALYNASRAAMALGESQRAVDLLQRSAAISPVSPAGRDLGIILGRQGRIRDAYRLLAPWVELKPDDVEARMAAAAGAIHLNRATEAQQLLAELDGDLAAVRVMNAEVELLANRPRPALETLAPLLENSPAEIQQDVLRLAADAHLRIKQPEKARDLLANVAASSPQLALLFAQASYQLGESGPALAALEPFARNTLNAGGIATAPVLSSSILLEYGRILFAQQKPAEALPPLEMAVDLQPNNRQGWQILGQALAAVGRREEARAALDQFQELTQAEVASTSAARQAAVDPELTRAVRSALEAMGQGDHAGALATLKEQIQAHPEDASLRQLEGRALVALGRNEEALASAEEAVRLAPEAGDTYYQRGVVKMLLGRAAPAEADLRKAIELTPNHVGALNDLAVVLMTRGNPAEARRLLAKVLEINPADPVAQENLAKLNEGP